MSDAAKEFLEEQYRRVGVLFKKYAAAYTDVLPIVMRSRTYVYHRHSKLHSLGLSRMQMVMILVDLQKHLRVDLGVKDIATSDALPPKFLNRTNTTIRDVVYYITNCIAKVGIAVTRKGSTYYVAKEQNKEDNKVSVEPAEDTSNPETQSPYTCLANEVYPIGDSQYRVVTLTGLSAEGYIITIKAEDDDEYFVHQDAEKVCLINSIAASSPFCKEELVDTFEGVWEEGITIRDNPEDPVALALNDFIDRAGNNGKTCTLKIYEILLPDLLHYSYEFDNRPEKIEPQSTELLKKIKQKLSPEEFEFLKDRL